MTIHVTVPTQSDLLVKPGQKVDFKTPLTSLSQENSITLNIAHTLGIAPADIFLSVKKVVGDKLEKGEILAQKKTLLSVKEFKSPYEGVIKEINHEDGNIVIQIHETTTDIQYCFFKGEVATVEKGKVELKVKNARTFELESASTSFGGETGYLDDPVNNLTEDAVINRVVFTPELKAFDQTKIEALGAVGLVTAKPIEGASEGVLAVLKKDVSYGQVKETAKNYCIIDQKTCKLYLYE